MLSLEQRRATAEQIRGVNRDARTVDIVASTFDIDSYGTRIDPNGWDLEQFKRNPVITLMHDDRGYTMSSGLPIANAIPDTVRVENGKLLMRLQFPDAGTFPVADQVFELMAAGFIRGVSVGFAPLAEPDHTYEDGQRVDVFRSQKLLEVAVVTIPSNDNALVESRSAKLGTDVTVMRRMTENLEHMIEERAVPKNVSTKKAPEDEAWSAPALKDFTDKDWSDLSDEEKTHIAGHYAWAKELPPASFGDLKLPHHDPKTGDVNFKGVAAAAARLDQADIPAADLPKVKAHLRAHYEQFGKDVPDVLEEGGKEDAGDKAKEDKAAVMVEIRVTDLELFNEFKTDFEKFKSYFERKQPVNKVASRAMERFFKARGLEQPADELEAFTRMSEIIEEEAKALEEVQTPEAPAPETPSEPQKAEEAPQPVRKASVQLPLSVVMTLRNGVIKAQEEAAAEALRQGIPVDKLGKYFASLKH